MATYNGHKSWDYWNVSLWIGNDEGLYNIARDAKRQGRIYGRGRPLHYAAESFIDTMAECGQVKTPDGARYTVPRVMAAIREL